MIGQFESSGSIESEASLRICMRGGEQLEIRLWGREVWREFGGSPQCVLQACSHIHTRICTYTPLLRVSWLLLLLLQQADNPSRLSRCVHLRSNSFTTMEKIGIPASLSHMIVIRACKSLSPLLVVTSYGKEFCIYSFLNVQHQAWFQHSWCSVGNACCTELLPA